MGPTVSANPASPVATPPGLRALTRGPSFADSPDMLAALETITAFGVIGWTLLRLFRELPDEPMAPRRPSQR